MLLDGRICAMAGRTLLQLLLSTFVTWVLAGVSAADVLVLDDPLIGGTSGTRSGGTFVQDGWRVDGQYDAIYWHLPYTIQRGALEFRIRGLRPNECRPGMEDKTELVHMYDYTYSNSDTSYSPGYRDNPYKHFIRKTGCMDPPRTDSFELLLKIEDEYTEPDSTVMSWDENATYIIREEWEPDGQGNTVFRVYRDGVLLKTMFVPGYYNPVGHCVRIGASTRRASDAGAPLGAVYSNVKVWDRSPAPPSAPEITYPRPGAVLNSRTPVVRWIGDRHSKYQMRITTADSPNSSVVWDSGIVTSSQGYGQTVALPDRQTYYVFVRIWNSAGWSQWSQGGFSFTVDTSCTEPNRGLVTLSGRSFCDSEGPFLGLGATYMCALRKCKYYRQRFENDLAFLASRGFNYVRILTMVGWQGKEIAPVTFQSPYGYQVDAWPDYWTQFKDCLDLAYKYGMRTEITIFADAQTCMPNVSDRYTHMDRLLATIAGREHKIVHLEVANEYWQNGFPGSEGVALVRQFGEYLAQRTSIPVSLSSPVGGDCASAREMYVGSAADLATIHFSRDTGTFEGGWLPVRDCWWAVNCPGLPPVSSNEPIGPGSSVSSETDPIKLVSAACFAWTVGLSAYVFHSRAGVAGGYHFFDMAGVGSYARVRSILPPDLPNWSRNDGKEQSAPFTVYCNGVANKYWTDPGFANATSGCHRNVGATYEDEFVCYCQGILRDGVQLQARRPVSFKVYDPLTGSVILEATKSAGDMFTLPQGPGAYIIRGRFLDVSCRKLKIRERNAPIIVDGDPAEWDLGSFQTPVRAGKCEVGDFAVVGYYDGVLYYEGYWSGGSMPSGPSDHSARVYALQDLDSFYFLVRVDDDEINCPAPVGSNWQNDSIEIYIDPGHDRGSSPISNSSSDVQLVIDAVNQRNVYCCTAAYRSVVLSGVTSAVRRDSSGWWAEIRIAKTALNPDVGVTGSVGLDFVFRDNDGPGDPAKSTVYAWADVTVDDTFPSKVPDKWGDGRLVSSLCFAEIFAYPNSLLNGNDGWSGTALSEIVVQNGAVRITGGATQYYADRQVSCVGFDGAAGIWARVKRGSGEQTMWSLYFDDPSGLNIARWYGQGTTARGRIGGGLQVTSPQTLTGAWDDLYVRVDFINNTSSFFFNGTHIGTLNHSEFGAGDVIGRIRIERVNNAEATNHYVYLDNILIGPADDLPPTCAISPPSVPITVSGPVSFTVCFSEAVRGFDASDVLVTATGTASASQKTVVESAPGTYLVTLSGISGSGKLGITIPPGACVDAAGNSNVEGTSSEKLIVAGSDGSIASIKDFPDGTEVVLRNKALYLKRQTFGYIEEPNRSSGIRVEGDLPCAEDDLVMLAGTIQTTASGERYIRVEAMVQCGRLALRPLGSNNRNIKQRLMDGLFVKTWSRVVPGSVAENRFYITDGSDSAGVKVITAGVPGVSDGELISVSGAAGWEGERVIYIRE